MMDTVIVDVSPVFLSLGSCSLMSIPSLMFLSFTSSYDDYDNCPVLSLLMILVPFLTTTTPDDDSPGVVDVVMSSLDVDAGP